MVAGLACALACAAPLRAQPVTVVADAGPGSAGRVLREILARPHRLIEPDTSWYQMDGRERARTSLVVLGRTAAIAGTVHGDVLVVGGDLHLRPGAHVTGRAVAIGGGVYPSARALAVGGIRAFRDETYDVTRVDGTYRLAYRSLRAHQTPPFRLPGLYGLRVPGYDRVNGLTLPFGPSVAFLGGRAEADVVIAYRSHIGQIDPAVVVDLHLTGRARARLEAQRGTFTNDAWIRSDAVNSLTAFGTGIDTRNYYRARRAELTLHHLTEARSMRVEPYLGAVVEDAWSVGIPPGSAGGGAPWSMLGRTSDEGMRRPNPLIDAGRIASALLGGAAQWESGEVRVRARARGERALDAPRGARFTQVTSDLAVAFPTFGLQEYAFELHGVTTFGETPPPQRFAYLGGSGTLAFLDLLEQGGDELLFAEQQYTIPIERIRLALLGSPTVLLRHRLGSAGIGSLPRFEQVLGLGVVLTLLRAELQVDPASGAMRFSAGLSFSR